VPGAAGQARRASAARLEAAAGEELAGVGPEAAAGQGGPAGADAAGGSFLDRAENVLVFGPPGSGKTHLLSALGQELVRSGRRVLSRKCGLLVQDLLLAKRDLKLAALLKRLAGYEALIVDDLGYVQQSREEMEVLFTLLAEALRAWQRAADEQPAVLGAGRRFFKDPMTTAAAIDRLVHHSVIIELNLPSYRAEQAKKAKQARQADGRNRPADRGKPSREKGGEAKGRARLDFLRHSSGVRWK